MTYDLESLGPERLQQLCQALVVQQHPTVQCLPVAQPDGGRDAFIRPVESQDGVVFQVKFSREKLSGAEATDWLVEALERERPKAEALAGRGFKQYLLLTNVSGTAHLDRGSIDKLESTLRGYPMPAQCWWRDDLERRIDGADAVKWAYPEILHATDFLKALVDGRLSDTHRARMTTLRAATAAEFEQDRIVRFRQVELENQLTDLFVDVPIRLRGERPRDARRAMRALTPILESGSTHEDAYAFIADESGHLWATADQDRVRSDISIGIRTARLLLHGTVAEVLPRIVLEGAPGQGKSTLGQFLCQVYRMLILDRRDDFDKIEADLRPTGRRLPFRVDLRDFATWLDGQDPFDPDDTNRVPAESRSLDSFLAHQTRHQSGGAAFDVSDLHAICELSAVLLVLDGLDEVADIRLRRKVVNTVTAGITRLEAIAASLQVAITSRPAAFANSPGFSSVAFQYASLGVLTPKLITAYAERWIAARRLTSPESRDIRRILRDKLDQPHARSRTQSDAALNSAFVNSSQRSVVAGKENRSI